MSVWLLLAVMTALVRLRDMHRGFASVQLDGNVAPKLVFNSNGPNWSVVLGKGPEATQSSSEALPLLPSEVDDPSNIGESVSFG